jgi:hypothetical protein
VRTSLRYRSVKAVTHTTFINYSVVGCRDSWVSGRVFCLLQRAFSLVSEDRRSRRLSGKHTNALILARHLGVLLACFTVDYRVLFEPLTEEIVQDGFQYYKTFFNAPLGIKVRKTDAFLAHSTDDFDSFFLISMNCVRATHVAQSIGATSWPHSRGSHRDHHENTPLGRECDVLRWRIVR